ncbi:MAG: SCO family protein [Acetobacteraceae bacterium]
MTRKPTPTGATPPPAPPSPTRMYAIIGVLLALLLIGTGSIFWLSGGNPTRSMIGGPFTLVNGDGKTVTDRTFRGKYMLVYFGYTFCPDVCPTTLNTVADALDRLGSKADRIQPVFITVDPKRDSPEVVKQYAAAFGPRIIGLTGTPEQIDTAARAYRVYYKEHRTGPEPNDYTMDHSSVLYLIGPDGAFVAPVRAEQSGADMAAALDKLVS